MKNSDQQLLRSLLIEFFESIDLTQRDVLSKNKTATLLKSNLSKLGFWKNRKRGNPSIIHIRKAKSSY